MSRKLLLRKSSASQSTWPTPFAVKHRLNPERFHRQELSRQPGGLRKRYLGGLSALSDLGDDCSPLRLEMSNNGQRRACVRCRRFLLS
jgi:hypothetical protein